MQPAWQAATSVESLYDEKMWDRIAGALSQRITVGTTASVASSEPHAAFYDQLCKFQLETLHTLPKEDEPSFRRLVEIARQTPAEEPPLACVGELMPGLQATVPTASSCVDSWGPYNQWIHIEGVDLSFPIPPLSHPASVWTPDPVPTDQPRVIHARVVATSQRTIITQGAGCWFSVSGTGVSTLTIDWYLNAHNYVSTGIFGTANGSIELYGSVWGARENRWVDHGGFGQTLTAEHYWGFSRYDGEERRLTGRFDAVAGGLYYCAAWTRVTGEGYGLGLASVELAANVNPLTVCGPS